MFLIGITFSPKTSNKPLDTLLFLRQYSSNILSRPIVSQLVAHVYDTALRVGDELLRDTGYDGSMQNPYARVKSERNRSRGVAQRGDQSKITNVGMNESAVSHCC